MRALLIFALAIGSSLALTCPPDYKLEEGIGCVRFLYEQTYDTVNNLLQKGRAECGKDGAHLPIIKDTQTDNKFNSLINSHSPDLTGFYLILDVVCNAKTRRLEWIDGANITYPTYLVAPFDQLDFDCIAQDNTIASRPSFYQWLLIFAPYGHQSTVVCVYDGSGTTTVPSTGTTPSSMSSVQPTAQPGSNDCGGYSEIANAENSKEPCFKLFTAPLSWESAQKQCVADSGSLISINSADENNFFRRTAVSSGILDGIHIGAHQFSANPSQWTWIDGEVPFDGTTYDNFASYFPILGAGECVAMLTDSTSAQWINEDCTDNDMPYICRRAVILPSIPATCPTDPPKQNEDFFAPGYPESLVPCDYMLFVAAKKLVQLEIVSLVTDGTKDYLEIFEGPAGSNLIANVTGPITVPTDFTTAKSNVMRVNWKTNGSGSGRGFRIRYYEVDPATL